MTMADRIGVMNHGEIVQVARPEVIYEAPSCRYVAEFLGDVNLFEARLTGREGERLSLAAPEAAGGFQALEDDPIETGATVWLAIRPEKLRVELGAPAPGTVNAMTGKVWDIGYTGDWTTYLVQLGNEKLVRVARANASRIVERPITWDDEVTVTFSPDAAVVLTR